MGQRSVLFYDIPVIESFKFYRDVYALSQSDYDSRLEILTSSLDLKPLLKIPVRKLSLGQRMRCEIVASMLHNPKILFLDEPTIGLDIIGKQKILDFLADLNANFNTTIFLTTHDLTDIDRLCKRIIILDGGIIRYDGDIRNLESRDRYKIIEIQHTGQFRAESLLPKGEILQEESNRLRVKILKEDLPWAMTLLNNPEILDVNINQISLEEILRDMYRAKVGEQNYA